MKGAVPPCSPCGERRRGNRSPYAARTRSPRRGAGLVERELFDEQPLRIEYFLTKHGRKTAAIASPLFTHLNHEAMTGAAS